MIICDSEHAVQPTCSTFQFVFISSRTPCAAVMEFSLGNYAISNNALFRDKDYALVGIQSIKSFSDLYKHQHCCYLPFSLSLVFN